MEIPYYRINGVNIIHHLIDIEWGEEDINDDDSGRTMDGMMHLSLIGRKDKHVLTFRPLDIDAVRQITNALTQAGQTVVVETNFHPKKTGNVTVTTYNSSRKAKIRSVFEDGDSVWALEPISLIEL